MIIQRAFKTKLRPTQEQDRYFRGCAGAARFVFNWALADRKAAYEERGESVGKYEQKRRFNAQKDEICPWIREYPYVVVERAFDDLDTAYKNFFRRVKAGSEKPGFPKFKKRGRSAASFCLGKNSVSIEDDRVKLPKIGYVRLAERGYLPRIPGDAVRLNRVTISARAGHWYISAQVEIESGEVARADGPPLGVDVGIKHLAVDSDGDTYENERALVEAEKRLARLSRELSRRGRRDARGRLLEATSNFKRTKAKVERAHARVADLRRAAQHRASRRIVDKKPSVIVLETLNVSGMMKNRRLAKHIADAGMSELHRQIEYKAFWAGSDVIRVDRWYASSKTCSGCGCIDSDLTLSDRTYHCKECGLEIDRDENAARNLAAFATA